MADIKAIRDKMKTNLQTVSGLFAYDTMPSMPVVPCAIVAPAEGMVVEQVSLDGCEDLEFVVTVLVQKVVDGASQDNVDTYLSEGTSSVVTALNSGKVTEWDYAIALSARDYGVYTFGDGENAQRFLGFEIPVQVAVS